MALRRQLLLLASLTLALPWAGCEYVREMEASLREGQQAALKATARAVEARLGSDAEMVKSIGSSVAGIDRFGADFIFYAHKLPGPVVVDGYGEEWRGFAIPSQRLPDTEPETRLSLGSYGETLYALIEVDDDQRRFFDPSQLVSEADHLLLQVGEMTLRVFSAAPGPLTVERYFDLGIWRREHRVAGIWNEMEDAYAVELRMPLSWGGDGFAVLPWDGKNAGAAPESLPRQALLREDHLYSKALMVFARAGVRLSLVTDDGWVLGRSGGLTTPTSDSQPSENLARQLVRYMIGKSEFPILTENPGRIDVGELTQGEESKWYRWSDSLVGRVVIPVDLSSTQATQAPVLLVAEQTMDSLHSLTTGAMGRLLWYTTLATLLVGVTLLAYASLLSWRIRRLSRAAQEVVDGEGRILADMPGSHSRDEIGDLARSYAALLQRLKHYNDYLETLASKLSHELRTPLAIVRSSLDNLAELERSEQQQVYLERATEGAVRLSRLLNAMSAASRLEHSLQKSELEKVDLAELLRHLVESYRTVYAPRTLVLTCRDDRPFLVFAAPELVAKMCDKLVENAADFTGEQGYIEFDLSRQRQQVRLQVINTGPPLPDTLQGRLFDSLTSERSGEGDHLGLGLYVVRLIAEFHQGHVHAFNHPDGGKVVFEVTFPVISGT